MPGACFYESGGLSLMQAAKALQAFEEFSATPDSAAAS
jgi:hypothetical protein